MLPEFFFIEEQKSIKIELVIKFSKNFSFPFEKCQTQRGEKSYNKMKNAKKIATNLWKKDKKSTLNLKVFLTLFLLLKPRERKLKKRFYLQNPIDLQIHIQFSFFKVKIGRFKNMKISTQKNSIQWSYSVIYLSLTSYLYS